VDKAKYLIKLSEQEGKKAEKQGRPAEFQVQ